jgi:GNAT superfamily N-acetyltransferase
MSDYNVEAIRADFPILHRDVHGNPLVYLDNGASAQKPRQVIDAVSHAYENEYANVHRGLHFLSNAATDAYEAARGKGVADALMRQIEDQARDLKLPMLKLETGNVLYAAHKLYRRHGFTDCGVFGDYVEANSSIFMEKFLND